MEKRLWLPLSLLVAAALFVGSCTGHPEGMENPRKLTEQEKAKVIDIALDAPRVSEWLEKESDYRIHGLDWYAIVWNSSGDGYSQYRCFPYDDVETDPNYKLVPELALWYPGVTIAVGEGTIYQTQIAVDLAAEKAVMVLGPYPSLSSPDRFKSPSLPQDAN